MKPVTDPELLRKLEGTPENRGNPVTDPEILARLEGKSEPVTDPEIQKGFGEQLTETIRGLPRAAALTGRAVAEGASAIPGMITDPIIDLTNQALPEDWRQMTLQEATQNALNAIGAPKPATPTERVSADVAKLLSAGGGIIGGARALAPGLKGTAKQVMNVLASRPDVQMTSALGAGAAGGVVRETGGDELAQGVAALAGGVAAPLAVAGARNALAPVKKMLSRLPNDADIDVLIDSILRPNKMNLGMIAPSVRESLRQDMQKALKQGELTPEVARRLVDYRITGLTPTAGPLSRDPGVFTKQKNLAAQGAASQDPALQRLSQIEKENARKLIDNLNELGAATPDTPRTAAQKVITTVGKKYEAAKQNWSDLYQRAREAKGVDTPLPKEVTDAFWKKAIPVMDRLGSKLPKEVRTRLEQYGAFGKQTRDLTVGETDDFIKLINEHYDPMNGPQKLALDKLRNAMKESVDKLGEGADEAARLFAGGRGEMAKWMRRIERTPALKAIVEGVEPDKFMQTYIIGSGKAASVNSVMRLKNLIKDSPEATKAVKETVARYLKEKALNQATDEVGRFSQSAYNRALNSIGDLKLKILFSPEEVQALKAIGRVASYEQVPPMGSAVNTSNTGAAIAALLDRIGSNALVRKVPMLTDQLRQAAAGMQADRLTRIPLAARPKPEKVPYLPPVLAPYFMENQ